MDGIRLAAARTLSPRLLPALLAASLCAGCGTFVTYPGPLLSDTEVATVKCVWSYYLIYMEVCHVSAVDGRRPGLSQLSSLASKLSPGRHWVEFGVERYFGGSGGTTEVCAFDHDFLGGHEYRIIAHSFEADIGWLQKHEGALYTGSIEVEDRGPGGESTTQRFRPTCSFGGGSLCRETKDCVPHPDIVCHPEEGHAFGRCVFKASPDE